jgi:ABC-type branched-subunit amino acid transport system permease subunit
MSVQFVYHVLITAGIFAILAAGAKFFLKLRGTLDFSYLAIVIFATYIGALLNIERGWSILAAMSGAFVMSLLFTFFVLYLSGKLDDIYFSIGTLALYILCYQLAYNLESVTG